MLKQMSQAGATSSLILGANVVPKIHSSDRASVILMHDDLKTVVENPLREIHHDE
jgi:hypothetical protein